MIMSLALASEPSLLNTPKNNPLCFSREESEEIYKCLKMRDDYLKSIPPVAFKNEDKENNLPWYISTFMTGALLGFIARDKSH